MAQIRLRDYNEPLTSFNHNLIQMLRSDGRFIGFDTMVQTDLLVLKITHTGSNKTYKNEINETVGPIGICESKQGMLVIETEELTGFVIEDNQGNPQDRIDYLVMTHQYVSITGGAPATYSIIKGPINDFSPPALNNPDFQTVIGRFIIPAGAPNLAMVTYEKMSCPDTGDGKDARLHTVNVFKTFNQQNVSDTLYGLGDRVLLGNKFGWQLRDNANSFRVVLAPALTSHIDAIRVGRWGTQDGSEIKLIIDYGCILRNDQNILEANIALGYNPIVIPSQYANVIDVDGSDISLAIRPGASEIWVVTLFRLDGKWLVINVQGDSNSSLKPGMVVEADLTSDQAALNFDGTGLGIRLYKGFQLCDGRNGTIDRRCRFSVMASTGYPSQGALALQSTLLNYALGAKGNDDPLVKILETMIPEHFHTIMTQPQGGGFQTQQPLTLPTGSTPYMSGSADTSQSNGYIIQGSNSLPNYGRTSKFGNPASTQQGVDIRPPWVATLKIMKL